MAREKTREEVRDEFMDHVRMLVDYWAETTPHDGRQYLCRDRISGFAHSLLTTIDGCSAGVPGFILAPAPHPEDKKYHQEEGSDWYPENHESDVKCDIGGGLHELLYTREPD